MMLRTRPCRFGGGFRNSHKKSLVRMPQGRIYAQTATCVTALAGLSAISASAAPPCAGPQGTGTAILKLMGQPAQAFASVPAPKGTGNKAPTPSYRFLRQFLPFGVFMTLYKS